jgi:hypothetical protein
LRLGRDIQKERAMAASLCWSKRGAFATAALLAVFVAHADSASPESSRTAVVRTLTVTIADAAGTLEAPPWGRVRSVPPGIDCPGVCRARFESGTRVELTSTPTRGYALKEWSALPNDPRCDQTPTCTLTLSDRFDTTAVHAFFHPAARLLAVPAGPGTLAISPTQPGRNGLCDVDFQQESPGCIQRYVTGERVTVTARPVAPGKFIGWSDYACRKTSRTCTLTMTGERFITARFSPVQLSINPGNADGGLAFGAVEVRPPSNGFCALTERSPDCKFTYPSGTLVTLRRPRAVSGKSWVGACEGNTGGLLDADVCQIRLKSDELVAAGADNVEFIPPPLGSGIHVTLGGNKRGRVTGTVVNGDETLNCGSRCTISGLTRYDRVRVVATELKGGRWVGWSDGNRLRKRTLQVSSVNRIKATFASRRR